MAHLVRRKGVYYAIEESYRPGPGMKPRKRTIKWLGRMAGIIAENLRPEPGGAVWDAMERQQLALYEQEQAAYWETLEKLPAGLHVGPIDPVEPSSPPLAATTDTADTPGVEIDQPTHTNEGMDGEPDAAPSSSEGSSDPSGSGEDRS